MPYLSTTKYNALNDGFAPDSTSGDTRRVFEGVPYGRERDFNSVWQGLKDAYVQGIQAVPEWLAGQMAPEVYTPGVIANTPKERIRANQMWREQDIARRRKELGRDYEQGMDFGNALSVVADPYFDGVLGAIPMLSKVLKLSAPRRTGNALQGLVADEAGVIGDMYGKNVNELNGLTVTDNIPNLKSINATFDNYTDGGIKPFNVSDFDADKFDMFYAKNDIERVDSLAKEISNNKYIDPLIVVKDAEGDYILEGGHRLAALKELGIKEFPALEITPH